MAATEYDRWADEQTTRLQSLAKKYGCDFADDRQGNSRYPSVFGPEDPEDFSQDSIQVRIADHTPGLSGHNLHDFTIRSDWDDEANEREWKKIENAIAKLND